MLDQKNIKLINGVLTGAISAVVLIIVLTIAGDLYPPLKKLLKDAHHHHWVGKGIWGAILFTVVTVGYIMLSKNSNEGTTVKFLKMLAWSVLGGTIILFLFFIYEFTSH